jgi:hypothetical protein
MREIVIRGLGRTNPEAFKFVERFSNLIINNWYFVEIY